MYTFEPHCDDFKCPIRHRCLHHAPVRVTKFPFDMFILIRGKHPCRKGEQCHCFKPKQEGQKCPITRTD